MSFTIQINCCNECPYRKAVHSQEGDYAICTKLKGWEAVITEGRIVKPNCPMDESDD